MKIRNGFVSNSSSSSFVLVVTEELHNKALVSICNLEYRKNNGKPNFNEDEQKFLDNVMVKKNIGGITLRWFSQINSQGECEPDFSDFVPDGVEIDDQYSVFSIYSSFVRENKDDSMYAGFDF